MTFKRSFAPVVDRHTRILILGSLPGDASLRAGRYYAHPRNQFWQLTGSAIGCDLAAIDYDERLATLLQHGVGLWDVVQSGKREGSLDAALREVEHNDLAEMVQKAPELVAIGFNGATSARIGRQILAPSPHLTLIDLPSSSPAYAAMPLAEKTRSWLALRPFLDQRMG
ncbi:DNA-deoxyinosine glycosylase [Croceicoccus ponticola]|uniref:DNA-deoxyinosine glycosylase n=1 Tax=Croceicoccus ponticola TaxID=2217664 RepID=A0A437GW47_9SPHN|nr:DNA-deoxyinosine glycosylase [Croceicoccus ponticola]